MYSYFTLLLLAQASSSFAQLLAPLTDQSLLHKQQEQQPSAHHTDATNRPYNIAIIGAGAAGSSTARYLSEFAHDSRLSIPPLNITIFEATDHIGGRTTTTNALNDPRYPVEVGGSIFVKVNQILYNASREYGLRTSGRVYETTKGAEYDLGIWDGGEFVLRMPNRDDDDGGVKGTLGGWWDVVKLLWRYGMSPVRVRRVQQETIGRFLRMYDEVFPFADLGAAVEEVGLGDTIGVDGREFLSKNGVGEKFAREIVEASTRVNYAQNLAGFHGLETMVCMSTDGAVAVEGGNWQIFAEMVRQSEAKVVFNTSIKEIRTKGGREVGGEIETVDVDGNTQWHNGFDTIILAAPLNSSEVTISPPPSHAPHVPDYVGLHVTLFASPFRPSPAYFGLAPEAYNELPETVLTTLPAEIDPDFLGRGAAGVGPTKFWSLSTLRTINPQRDGFLAPGYAQSGSIPAENLVPPTYEVPDWPGLDTSGKLYLYKIFSPKVLTAESLIQIFGWRGHPSLPEHIRSANGSNTEESAGQKSKHHSIQDLPKDLLPWSHEKLWRSYPYLPPTTEFDCFDVYSCRDYAAPLTNSDEQDDGRDWAGKLYYTNSFERFISTMETSALAGRNVARLIVDDIEKRTSYKT